LIQHPVQLVQARQSVARDASLAICQIWKFPAWLHEKCLLIQVTQTPNFSDKIPYNSANAA
jgi:hypothetical protein